MTVKHEQLARHLGEKLYPVYLVSGDEPLLIQESCDLIRKVARERGFLERKLLHGDKGDAEVLLSASETMSLFAELKIYEFRFKNTPTEEFCNALLTWFDNPVEDQFLLISCSRLDKRSTNKAWYKKFKQTGIHVEVWPVDSKNLPGWIVNRARKAGLNLETDALKVLVERVEGNLLAAQQEIERLSLLYAKSDAISAEMMKEYVGDNSRFDSFALLEAGFSGSIHNPAW